MLPAVVSILFVLAASGGDSPSARGLYLSQCAPCHGSDRRGDGADAALLAKKKAPDLSSAHLRRYSTSEIEAKIRDGRELPLALDRPALWQRAGDVEAIVAFLERLPDIPWPAVEEGEVIYFDRCVDCHGTTGRPPARLPAGVKAPRDLGAPAFQRSLGDEELLAAVRHGRDGMPALLPRISESDGAPLLAYVRLLSPGFELYQRHCMSCHGRDGRGVGTLGEERALPTVVFDEAYFGRTDPEELRAKVWHMESSNAPAMPHYRRLLTDEQIRSLAEYLRSAPAP